VVWGGREKGGEKSEGVEKKVGAGEKALTLFSTTTASSSFRKERPQKKGNLPRERGMGAELLPGKKSISITWEDTIGQEKARERSCPLRKNGWGVGFLGGGGEAFSFMKR